MTVRLKHQINDCNAYYRKHYFSKQYTFNRMDKNVSYVTEVLNKLKMTKTIRIELLVPLTKTAKMLIKTYIQLFPGTKYAQSCRLV